MVSKLIDVCDVLPYFFSSENEGGWRDFTDGQEGTDIQPLGSLFTATLTYCGIPDRCF